MTKPSDDDKPSDDEPDASVETAMNIGPKCGGWLRQVGIETRSQLGDIGAVAAFERIRRTVGIDHLMLLYALHGAIADRNLLDLDAETKCELRKAIGR